MPLVVLATTTLASRRSLYGANSPKVFPIVSGSVAIDGEVGDGTVRWPPRPGIFAGARNRGEPAKFTLNNRRRKTVNTFKPNTLPESNFSDDNALKSDAERAGKSAEAFDKLKTSAAETASQLKNTAASVSTDAKDYAGSVAADAAGAFKEAVESNKTAGADAIANIAHSVKEAADGIEKQSPQVAGMVRSAAEGVERISTDIRDRNVGELLDSVTKFAQRQPAAFFGVGILAGVMLTRIMRSSDRS
jgi:hypothetical protein